MDLENFRYPQFSSIICQLMQVAEQRPDDASTCLLAARLCYEKLDLLSEGIAWAEQALAREESVPQDLRARCHLYLGVGRFQTVCPINAQLQLLLSFTNHHPHVIGTSSPMRLRRGSSALVSAPLLAPTLSLLETSTPETTLPSSTLACTSPPSAGYQRLTLLPRELSCFSLIIFQGDLDPHN